MSRRYQPLRASHAATIAAHAARSRHAPTDSERALWAELAAKKLGIAFRRQYVVGRFIADFAAPSHRLIVEVDRGYHARRAAADAAHDAKLLRLGWRVLRVKADDVRGNLEGILNAIRAALQAP